jgi:hypothetical protein
LSTNFNETKNHPQEYPSEGTINDLSTFHASHAPIEKSARIQPSNLKPNSDYKGITTNSYQSNFGQTHQTTLISPKIVSQPPIYQEESIEDLGFGNSSGKKLENKMTESKVEEPLKKVVKKTSIFSSIFGIFGSREPLPPQAHLPVGSGFVFEGGKWFNKNKPMDESPPAIAPPPRNAPMPSAGPNMLSTSPTQPNTRAPPTSGPHAAPSKNIRSKYVDVFNNGAQAAAIPTPIITSFVPNYQVSASSPPKMVFFINESSFPKFHLTSLLHLMTHFQPLGMSLSKRLHHTYRKQHQRMFQHLNILTL